MSNGLPYIHISTMHHTLISIFFLLLNSNRLRCVASHLLHIQKQHDWTSTTIWYNSNGNYVRKIEEIIHWSLLHSSTCCGIKKRLWKYFLTLNGHGISDARCSLWISIFFHTFFLSFAIPSFSFFHTFFLACLGIDSADIVKYVVICCAFVCLFYFFRIQNTKWYDVKLPLLEYFDSIRNIKWWNSYIRDATDSYSIQYAFGANEKESKGERNE